MLDAVDYKAARQRNDIRNSWWRTAAAAIETRDDAIVIYLPGENDLDRAVAKRYGFKDWNLLAVETNPKVVRTLRRQGVTVIPGSLSQVLRAWPPHAQVSFIAADLQCGWCSEVKSILESSAAGVPFDGAVLLLNLQRGREADKLAVEEIREIASESCFQQKLGANPLSRSAFAFLNRGQIEQQLGQFSDRASKLADAIREALRGYPSTIIDRFDGIAAMLGELGFVSETMKRAIRQLPPNVQEILRRFERKNFLKFWPGTRAHPAAVVMDSGMSRTTSAVGRIEFADFDPKVRRRIVAALAIRTMRMSGHLRRAG